jgi:SAM-dependent methyltransferase
MSLQYNGIQKAYEHIRETPSAVIRKEHVRMQTEPFIRGKRVLDLACGSGGYTFDLLRWGASQVVAVDISPVMIQAAKEKGEYLKQHSLNGIREKIDSVTYQVADCTQPAVYEGGPFDVVFAAWLLNYAPTKEDMTNMFRTISLNLVDGGYFFAIVPPNSSHPRQTIEHHNRVRPPRQRKAGFFADSIEDVADGILVHYIGYTPTGGDLRIDTYHLTQDVHEKAARAGGLAGELQWIRQKVPPQFLDGSVSLGVPVDELASYNQEPDHALLSVRK